VGIYVMPPIAGWRRSDGETSCVHSLIAQTQLNRLCFGVSVAFLLSTIRIFDIWIRGDRVLNAAVRWFDPYSGARRSNK
jgi:hypothetical protein